MPSCHGWAPDARNGTVDLGGRTVQSFVTPTGDGYAYAAGPTVVIGYITPATDYGLSGAATQEPAKDAYARIIAAADGAPAPEGARPRIGPESYPLARGGYTAPGDPGWIFFKTDDLKGAIPMHCGIAPGGTMAGCDVVAANSAPAGTNQTVVDGSGPARYIHSDTTTFTRDVDVLAEGHRLQNGPAVCWMGYQGSVHCEIGAHGFTVNRQYGTLE